MPQAVILAGGKGTRLQERLQGRPKPLIDICGVPLLERQILLCKQHGFDHILILVNHAADQIVDFCAQHDNWGIRIDCIDDGEPRGTAGAVLAILDRLDDQFLVIYGDTMLAVDLGRFWRFHIEHNADATLFLHPNDHPQDSDLVSLDDDGSILAFHPYPHQAGEFLPNLVNAALYVLRKEALEPWVHLEGLQDFGKNVFPLMLGASTQMVGYNSPEYIKDVGTPKRVDKVEAHLTSGLIAASSLDVPQPVVFLDRDGVINEDPGWLRSAEQFELMEGVSNAIRRLNATEYRSVVVTNQPVVARGECTLQELRNIHNKMDTLLGADGAYIDRLYFCPHHPDKGFEGEVGSLKIACACRKPGTAMLEQARKDLNADFSRSWIIGDSAADIEMGHRADVPSILVETTPKSLPKAVAAQPDFTQPNLQGAVDFILDEWPRLLERATQLVQGVADGEVILVGGMAHSGKSTLASAIRLALKRQGRPSLGISLDRWIFSETDRTEGVLGRYDMKSIRRTLGSLVNPRKDMELEVPAYDAYSRTRIENSARIRVRSQDIVVVDGVVALEIAKEIPGKRVFVEVEEAVRRQRFLRKYALRGLSPKDALSLYESRRIDEEPIVKRSAAVADEVIVLPLGGLPVGH